MLIPDREDLLWLAGLLEGEGCFDLRGKSPRIRLSMTDRDVVGRAATLFGSRVRVSLRRYPSAAVFHTEINGDRATELLTELLPHMGARRSSKIATILGHANSYLSKGLATQLPGPRISRPPALPLAIA